jgi:hypothetical protein
VYLSTSLFADFSLAIADQPLCGDGQANARLAKGLLLVREGKDLVEKAVGFGVPILKRGPRTIFPGSIHLAENQECGDWSVTATYEMNLVERLARAGSGSPTSTPFYAARDALAALHRRLPLLRGVLTATSNTLRRSFGWATIFEETTTCATVTVTYDVYADEGRVHVVIDLGGVPKTSVSEVMIMNELGARTFNRYFDAAGTSLEGIAIGTWNKVAAESATFVCAGSGVSCSLRQEPEARLYRGRELVGSRLAWSGFGYSLPPAAKQFSYDVHFARTP